MADIAAVPLTPASPPRGTLARAERFVWLTARVLERRLFARHFRDGAAGPVETALEAYRNDDGGYGHALEPALRGPASLPVHTARALHVLDAVGRCDARRAEDVCRYLTSVSTTEGALPAVGTLASGGGAARLPGSLSATAPVVGLLHRNEVWHPWLFRATDFCRQAVESLEAARPGDVEAAVLFLDHAPDRTRGGRQPCGWAAWYAGNGWWCSTRTARVTPPARSPTTTRAPRTLWRARGSPTRRWSVPLTPSRPHSRTTEAGPPMRLPGAPDLTPGALLESRSIATIEALRTLTAYGHLV